MPAQENTSGRNYTIFAAVLMVVLLAFGLLHTVGIFR
jgi:hypothetical protein